MTQQIPTVPSWYLASSLRGVAAVLRQHYDMTDAELVRLWRSYMAEGVAPGPDVPEPVVQVGADGCAP